MPNMKIIRLCMCIRYDLDSNNIKIPFMFHNKVPQCNLTQLSVLNLSYNVIGSSGCKLLAKMNILSTSQINLSTYIAMQIHAK